MKQYVLLRLLLLGAFLMFSNQGWGETIVTTEGGLIDAVEKGGTISLENSITLTQRITIDKDVTIIGNDFTITGQGDEAVTGFDITAEAKVTIRDLTITKCKGGARGGAIYNRAGELTLINCTLSENTATYGGAIFTVTAETILKYVTLSKNSATRGGALYVQTLGVITADDSKIIGNSATSIEGAIPGMGGGIFANLQGGFIFTNVLIAQNKASDEGGGIYAIYTGNVTLTQSTVADNISGKAGGGVYIKTSGVCNVEESIIWNNKTENEDEDKEDNYVEVNPTYKDGKKLTGIIFDDVSIEGNDKEDETPLLDEKYIPYEGSEAAGLGFFPEDYVPKDPPVKQTPSSTHTLTLEVAPGIDLYGLTPGTLDMEDGAHLYLQFLPEDRSLNADAVILLVDGQETAFRDLGGDTYFSYILSPVEQDHTILIALREYPVTLPHIEGAVMTPGPGEWLVAYGQAFRFSLTGDLDPALIHVYVGEKEIQPDALRTVTLTYTIDAVTGPITITVEGTSPTANASLTHGIRLVIDNGQLTIDNEMGTAVDVAVYTVTGQNVVQLRELRGSRTIALPAGVYIVRAGQQSWKVIVSD